MICMGQQDNKIKIGEFTMEQRMMETIQLVSSLMIEKERMLSLAYMNQCTNL
jgi:coenzyme F420-reducing hydrogenase delta subunit